MKIEFHEKQKFTQWWLWLLLIAISVLPFIGIFFSHLIFPESDAENISDSSSTIIFAVTMVLVIILFLLMTLKTEIDQKAIKMSFFPFVKKRIEWKDVKKAEVINYGFVGGWGIRLFTNYGTVYNTSGNKGLALELQNGKRLVIGTQKEQELSRIVKNIYNQS
ncbi:hypothetical protein [Flavobacterium ardleyense]|uniref:hypothetical protein n=1 Tax=Flavobacterium ardleyense TaxID=2038737 RepID=UPI00298BE64A|nr:hypothetical protein [Flavobacterium ardleyense]